MNPNFFAIALLVFFVIGMTGNMWAGAEQQSGSGYGCSGVLLMLIATIVLAFLGWQFFIVEGHHGLTP